MEWTPLSISVAHPNPGLKRGNLYLKAERAGGVPQVCPPQCGRESSRKEMVQSQVAGVVKSPDITGIETRLK
jgi:hypothetical protein